MRSSRRRKYGRPPCSAELDVRAERQHTQVRASAKAIIVVHNVVHNCCLHMDLRKFLVSNYNFGLV